MLDDCDADGYSLLHTLTQYNYPVLIALLVEKRCWRGKSKSDCVNKRDKWGVSPLLLAAANGHAECVLLLLRNGADVSLQVLPLT